MKTRGVCEILHHSKKGLLFISKLRSLPYSGNFRPVAVGRGFGFKAKVTG